MLRIEETAIGATLGMLAGFLILPTGTREAFGTALDEVVDATYAVLDAAVERILGRPVAVAPVELARDQDAALGVLRQRAYPLDNPQPDQYCVQQEPAHRGRPLRPPAGPHLRRRARPRLGRDPAARGRADPDQRRRAARPPDARRRA